MVFRGVKKLNPLAKRFAQIPLAHSLKKILPEVVKKRLDVEGTNRLFFASCCMLNHIQSNKQSHSNTNQHNENSQASCGCVHHIS